jgi:mono/diheme cytochrome c family protein
MRTSWTSILASIIVFGAAACGVTNPNQLSGSDPAPEDAASGLQNGDDAGEQGGVGVVDGGAGTGANTGLPCDVQQILEVRCIACHSTSLPLLTYANLMAPSTKDPSKTMAQESLVRMQSTTSPMPPPPAVAPTSAEIATFAAWVSANTPKGQACTALPDAGTDAGSDAGTQNPYNTPTVCTSNKYWTSGTGGSMAPGEACQACHQKQGGPSYTIAGTVYPTAHEPKDCDGVAGGVSVVVTDANKNVITLTANSAGNFSSGSNVAAPFNVKVTSTKGTRAMSGSLTSGDCNSCHTTTGANGAPGRIMAP